MKPSEEEIQLWICLNRIHRRSHRDIEAQLAAQGLPLLRWYDVLWAVELSGQTGSKASELAERLLFEQSNLSRIIHRMVAKNLINEKSSPTDQRVKILTISDLGKDLRRRMWEVYGPLIHKHMSETVSPQDATVLQVLRANSSG